MAENGKSSKLNFPGLLDFTCQPSKPVVERKRLSSVQVPSPQRALVLLFHAKWESQDKREVIIVCPWGRN